MNNNLSLFLEELDYNIQKLDIIKHEGCHRHYKLVQENGGIFLKLI